MGRAKTSKSWANVKSALREGTPAQLIDLIRDLYQLDSDNRQFLHTRCLGPDVEFQSFRARVAESIFPDPLGRDPIRLSEAKRAIREFERAPGDSTRTLDFMLTFVEQGTEQSADLGYGEDSYFASLESMLDAALAKLVAEPRRYSVALRRCP